MKQGHCMAASERGLALLDVVLAIAVFAFGMLALVQLQGGIAQSGADATARTVAASIAEELVENLRGFDRVIATDNGRIDYAEIVSYDTPQTELRGGIDYLVDLDVTDYYYVPDPDDADATPFTSEQPEGVVISDFKVLDIGITWNVKEELAGLGSGNLNVREIIPSTPSLVGAKIAAEQTDPLGGVNVPFQPGDNPDIVALQIDGSGTKFKESTSPEPDVVRGDLTQTWFDVVTYSKANGDAIFLRREEFAAVTCECDLFSDADTGGLRPTLWNGYDYTEGNYVVKNFGARAAGSPKSLYCDVCCADHHDGDSTSIEDVYNPLVASGTGDHPHYARDDAGNIKDEPATAVSPEAGDTTANDYIEACRLVRKDGYMRVTQDAVQQGLYGFPEEYLVFDDNVAEYSDYVVNAVEDYYEAGQTGFPQPEDLIPPYVIPASTGATATNLPTAYFSTEQQMRSRGVYTDYLTAEAQSNLDNCFDADGTPTPDNDGCNVPFATSPLELYPFFDLQLTWLNRWNEVPIGTPIEVSNDPVQSGNTHSRGRAKLVDPLGTGQTDGKITSHKGNLGLTATGPIDHSYASRTKNKDIYINANEDATPSGDSGFVISGSLASGAKGVKAADLTLSPDNALCGQTDVQFTCLVTASGGNLTIGGYYKNNTALWACSDTLAIAGSTVNPDDTTGGTASTTFTLPGSNLAGASIWIQTSECG